VGLEFLLVSGSRTVLFLTRLGIRFRHCIFWSRYNSKNNVQQWRN